MKRSALKAWFQVHLVVGLTVGIWLAVVGATGTLLVFAHDIERNIYPEMTVTPGPQPASTSRVLEAARRATGERPERVLLGQSTDEAWEVTTPNLRIFVDPYRAQVTGVRAPLNTWRGFLHALHARMLLGDRGETLCGIAGGCLLLLLFSGILLWWPHRRLRIDLKRVKRIPYDLHQTAGALAAPALALSALTGMALIGYGTLDRAAGAPHRLPRTGTEIASTDIDRTLAIAVTAVPGAQVTAVDLRTPITVRMRRDSDPNPLGNTFVRIDAASQSVLQIDESPPWPSPRRLLQYVYPIHVGLAGGLPMRILLALVGLVPITLMLTGAGMYYTRFRARNRATTNALRTTLALLWSGQFLTTVGLTILVPLMPYFLETLGVVDPDANRWWSGWCIAAPALPLALAAPFWGRIGDRCGRKWMVVRALCGIGCAVLGMGLARTPAQFLVARILQGLFGGVDDAGAALTGAATRPAERGRALGLLQTSTAAGALVGPLLGGFLCARLGFSPLVLTCGVLILAAAVAAALFLREPARVPSLHVPIKIFADPAVRRWLCAGLLVQLGTYGIIALFATQVRALVGGIDAAAPWVGALHAVTWTATLFGASFWGRRNDRHPVAANFALAAVGCALSVALQPFAPNPAALVPLRLLQGFCLSALGQTVYLYVSRRATSAAQGVSIGIANSFLTAGQIGGALIGAALSSLLPAAGVFAIMAASFGAAALLVQTQEGVSHDAAHRPGNGLGHRADSGPRAPAERLSS